MRTCPHGTEVSIQHCSVENQEAVAVIVKRGCCRGRKLTWSDPALPDQFGRPFRSTMIRVPRLGIYGNQHNALAFAALTGKRLRTVRNPHAPAHPTPVVKLELPYSSRDISLFTSLVKPIHKFHQNRLAHIQ